MQAGSTFNSFGVILLIIVEFENFRAQIRALKEVEYLKDVTVRFGSVLLPCIAFRILSHPLQSHDTISFLLFVKTFMLSKIFCCPGRSVMNEQVGFY